MVAFEEFKRLKWISGINWDIKGYSRIKRICKWFHDTHLKTISLIHTKVPPTIFIQIQYTPIF
ncbi:unnamed protein product [Meloidogyne enterolobii]|uniref:Uncharacterized protein n=1 Tax=Meloidogyne enterolobii TaxID=390850 RepID=A0ACB0ZKL1_MELEN